MISQPHFNSHAEQQAMLGCAARLDPHRHPRRWALQQARNSGPRKNLNAAGPQIAEQQATRDELAPKVRELAAQLSQTQIAKRLGISRTLVRVIGLENDIQFRGKNKPPPWTAEQITSVKAMAETMRIGEVSDKTGISLRRLRSMAETHEFAFTPGPGHKHTPAELAAMAERIRACRDMGVPRSKTAVALSISYDTFQRVCAEFGIEFPVRARRTVWLPGGEEE